MTTGKATPMEAFSLDQLRGILSDEITKIRAGESTAATVNAVSNASGKILASVKLELEYQRLSGRKPNIPLLDGGRADDGAADSEHGGAGE